MDNTAQVKRQYHPVRPDVEEADDLYVTRPPSSARRYRSAPPTSPDVQRESGTQGIVTRRRSSLNAPNTDEHGQREFPDVATEALRHTDDVVRPRRFPLIPVLVGMGMMVVLFMVVSSVGTWWQTYQDDLHYGRPRTFQMDAVVGHHDSKANQTHFIFLNLNRHVEIIEFPGGDASQAHIYIGPVLFGDHQDLSPVTGEIRDVNGDGRPDLIVHIQNQQIYYINDGTTFHAR